MRYGDWTGNQVTAETMRCPEFFIPEITGLRERQHVALTFGEGESKWTEPQENFCCALS